MAAVPRPPRRVNAADEPPIYASSSTVLRRFFRDYEVHIDVGKVIGREWNVEEAKKDETNSGDFISDDLAFAEGLLPVKKYQMMVERIVRRESKVIDVWLDDLDRWREKETQSGKFALLDAELRLEARELPEKIEQNTLRYIGLMEEELDEMVKEERQNEKLRRRSRLLGLQNAQDGDWQQSMDLSQPMASSTPANSVREARWAVQEDEEDNSLLMGPDGQIGDNNDEQSKRRMKSVQAKLKRV